MQTVAANTAAGDGIWRLAAAAKAEFQMAGLLDRPSLGHSDQLGDINSLRARLMYGITGLACFGTINHAALAAEAFPAGPNHAPG